ncbi:MAG: FtsB family cell division protein, partial [Spirosomataceae bacterium]
ENKYICCVIIFRKSLILDFMSRFKKQLLDIANNKYRFYTLTFLGLFIWMLFFDANDIFTQIRMYRELARLEDERVYYVEKLKALEKERMEVMGNKKLIEKFAREKYLMKKPKEEIFVLVDEENQPIEK